jgi:hypothetical protein
MDGLDVSLMVDIYYKQETYLFALSLTYTQIDNLQIISLIYFHIFSFIYFLVYPQLYHILDLSLTYYLNHLYFTYHSNHAKSLHWRKLEIQQHSHYHSGPHLQCH